MKLPYRSEIDGLRTVAVLSVILYHAQIVVFGNDFFKGGFVGVDIFFVISGYLISRILLSELFEKGKISFLQFYERRARRILPILFTVFIVSFPLAYKYLLPNQFIEYAHSILSATFFGSNIFFYFTNTQYGAEDSLLQPFLHTWSLGVEEQFYILFPIVLLLAYKFAKNHLVTIIAVLILISLQYADWQSTKNTQLNFFMLTSRLWELGIGSLLAFYELKYGRVKHELLNQTMPLLGLAMIAHAIVFFNNQTPHPSFITLLPTLGTALIILYSENTTDLVGKTLSWKPIVGVGLISYSMYLWHYPLFAFARIVDTNGLHNDEKYLLILLTIVLSIVSYFVIEKPFRNKQFLNIKKFSVAIMLLLIAVLGMNWKVIETKGFEERFPKIFFKTNKDLGNKVWLDLKDNKGICHNRIENFCKFGDSNAKKIFIIGDSIMASYMFDLVERLVSNYQIIILTSGNCLPSENIENKKRKDCSHNVNKNRLNKILDEAGNIVITSNLYNHYLTDGLENNVLISKNKKSINENYRDSIELLSKKNDVIIIYPNLSLPKTNTKNNFFSLMPKSNNASIINNWLNSFPLAIPKSDIDKQSEYSYSFLNKINNHHIHKIYSINLLCNTYKANFCVLNNENDFLFSDIHHISNEGAKLINSLIIDKLKEID